LKPTFETACRAIRGSRKRQEDAATCWPGASTYDESAERPDAPGDQLLAVLADGMGGHAGGEIASRTVCEAFVQTFAHTDIDMAVDERLSVALAVANDTVARVTTEHPALAGMGSTAVGIVLRDATLQWISVGDSPLYLVRDREAALLNADHSLAPALDQLVEQGKLSAEAARNDPRRHMLRSAVTGEPLDLIDLSRKPLDLIAGDIVVLASDGVHAIEMDEIARIATAYAADTADEIASAILRAVETVRDPMQDNTTLIVVKVADVSRADADDVEPTTETR